MFRYCVFGLTVALCVGASLAAEPLERDVSEALAAALGGKSEAAIERTTELLRTPQLSAPQKSKLLSIRAYAELGEDRQRAAERDFNDALLVAPDDNIRRVLKRRTAEAYHERAETKFAEHKWDQAVSYYSKELEFGQGTKDTYQSRGVAHRSNCELDEAMADFTKSIEMGGGYEAYIDRGMTREMKLDVDGAIADYSKAIALDRENSTAIGLRGRAHAVMGHYASSQRDLEQAVNIDPRDVSSLLWLHLLHMKMHKDDGAWLRKRVAIVYLKEWPGPVIEYFLGKKTAADIVHIALTSTTVAEFHQRCDGWFYLGEETLARGDVGGAALQFRKTATHCNAVDYEWPAAMVELRMLEK
ncbi:MAG: hypothetical protein WCA81_03005 [Rhizomicrobium sp.]